jgi:hypothetical protein
MTAATLCTTEQEDVWTIVMINNVFENDL